MTHNVLIIHILFADKNMSQLKQEHILNHNQKLINDLSLIYCNDKFVTNYCDVNIVCSDGVIRQNKSVIVIVLPFLRSYFQILDVLQENQTIILPDVSIQEVNEKLRFELCIPGKEKSMNSKSYREKLGNFLIAQDWDWINF